MSIELGSNLASVTDEQMIKGYHLATFRTRLLRTRSDGHLAVTTKRVIFRAIAKDSVIYSSIPINDVSGVGIRREMYFSWLHFIGVVGIASVVNVVVYLLRLYFIDQNYYMNESFNILMSILYYLSLIALVATFWINRRQIWRSLLAVTAAPWISPLFWPSDFFRILEYYPYSGIWAIIAPIASIYVLICYIWFATRPTMSLNIYSKSGTNAPISIAGAGTRDIIVRSTLLREAEPAVGADQIVMELDAMILDIQQHGDFAIERWKS
jgi:hypothetical protein